MDFLMTTGIAIFFIIQGMYPYPTKSTNKVEYVQTSPFPGAPGVKITYTKAPTPWVKVVNN